MKPFIVIVFAVIAGCTLAQVKVDVLSERTALENQVLGTYNSLDDEMLLAASVRGVDPKGNIKPAVKQSQDHKDAIAALQVQDFHEDDIRSLKKLGWVGENNQGLLETFSMDKGKVPVELKAFSDRYTEEEFNSVVSQVNASRETMMQRVIDMNETLTEKDLPEIRRIFGKLNAENALPGEKIQSPDGAWTVKK